jgi:hypothetical protein
METPSRTSLAGHAGSLLNEIVRKRRLLEGIEVRAPLSMTERRANRYSNSGPFYSFAIALVAY